MAKDNKQGTVFYDKSKNKWRVRYYILDEESKTYKHKTKIFDDEKEAREFLKTKLYQRNNDLYIKNNGIPLNQLMRTNLQRKFDMNLISDTQYSRIEKTINAIEKTPIVKKKIEEITSDEIQDYLNTLTHYSNSYIKKIYEQFTQSFNLAMNKGYITKNPLFDVIKPKSKKQDKIVRALDVDEQHLVSDYYMNKTAIEEPYKNIILIQMFMGLRVGEACALKSTDIDLHRKLLFVNKTITLDRNEKRILKNMTKTTAGMREVPIPSFMIEPLIEQINISKNNKDNQLFLSPNGNYIDNRNVNYSLKKTLNSLGITGISTHSLRHTFGTRCIESGMRPVALQRIMGHNDISVTLNTYTTIFNKYKEEELKKLNEYYINNSLLSSPTLSLNNDNPIVIDDEDIEIDDNENQEISRKDER